MIPIQMNPMATQGLAQMYSQQRAIMEQSQQIGHAAQTGQVEKVLGTQASEATQATQATVSSAG